MTLAAPTVATDRELARSVQDRSQDALAEVYRRHSAAVFGLALRVTKNHALAEEVVQEVFVRLWRNPERYDPDRGSLRSYLLSHSHGRSVDLIRSESSRRRREDKDARMVAESGPSIDEEVFQLQMAEQVRAALASLDPRERDAIELAYFGGHSYREVATMLDQPEGTVKSRIRSGLKRLHEQLKNYE